MICDQQYYFEKFHKIFTNKGFLETFQEKIYFLFSTCVCIWYKLFQVFREHWNTVFHRPADRPVVSRHYVWNVPSHPNIILLYSTNDIKIILIYYRTIIKDCALIIYKKWWHYNVSIEIIFMVTHDRRPGWKQIYKNLIKLKPDMSKKAIISLLSAWSFVCDGQFLWVNRL